MRLIVLLILCFHPPAFAKARKAVEPGFPELVSYGALMALTPLQRERYLARIAQAISEFETAANQKLGQKQYARIETLPDLISLYLQISPDAQAASDEGAGDDNHTNPHFGYRTGRDGKTKVCYFLESGDETQIPCARMLQAQKDGVLPNLELVQKWRKELAEPPNRQSVDSRTQNPPAPQASAPDERPSEGVPAAPSKLQNNAPAREQAAAVKPETANPGTDGPSWEDAKKSANECKFGRKSLNGARTAYAGAIDHSGDCMIGGIPSKYAGGKPAEGRCEPQRKWKSSAGDLCSSKQTLCNPMLFCQDGKPICQKRAQNTAQQCFKAAGLDHLTEDKLREKIRDDKGCGQNVTPQDWTDLRTATKGLCSRIGADVLFCVECRKLAVAIQKANDGVAMPHPPPQPKDPKGGDPKRENPQPNGQTTI